MSATAAPAVTETAIAEYRPMEAAVADLRAKYGATHWEVRSVDGMKAAKEARAAVREFRFNLEHARKEAKSEILARGRLLDSEAARITSDLMVIETPIDEAIKAEEKRIADEKAAKAKAEAEAREAKERAERERVLGLRDRIAAISAPLMKLVDQPAIVIGGFVKDLEALAAEPGDFQEMQSSAASAIADTLERARSLHAKAVEREAEAVRLKAEQEKIAAERAELERLRAEQDKRDAEAKAAREAEEKASRERIAKEEADARAKREAEEAKLRAEREAEEAKLRAEREAIEADRRAKAEAERKAREAAEAKEREARWEQQKRMDADQMLQAFVTMFGGLPEYAAVVASIEEYFAAPPKRGDA